MELSDLLEHIARNVRAEKRLFDGLKVGQPMSNSGNSVADYVFDMPHLFTQINNPKIVRFDIRTAIDCGENRHPQNVMAMLGIKYSKSEPFPVGDCWLFHGVDSTHELPKYIKYVD